MKLIFSNTTHWSNGHGTAWSSIPEYPHMAPFGYSNMRKGKDSFIVIDESKAFIIKKIFRDFLSGVPAYLIHQDAKKMGFTLTGRDAIVRVLNNAAYAGLIKIAGDEKQPERYVKGTHEAIIPEYQYWRAQELMTRNKRVEKVQPRDDFPLRGIIKCQCGGNLTAGYSKGKKNYYPYYKCTKHPGSNVSGTVLHEKMEQILDYLSLSKSQVDQIVSTATDSFKDMVKVKTQETAAKKSQLKELQAKIDRLEERVVNEEIEVDTYRKYYKKFQAEKARLNEEIIFNQKLGDDQLRLQMTLLPSLTSLPEVFKKANLNQKHSLLKGVFEHVSCLKKGHIEHPTSIRRSRITY